MKIGITGQDGFIGNHLYNFLQLQEDLELTPFRRSYFEATDQLKHFVRSCDVIVHLAAMNRHPDPEVIYRTNIRLVEELIGACEATDSRPHIIFSSSTQEEKDNRYGQSKREGRMLLEKWAKKNEARFTGLVIPNVFGPFGKPYYNSVVATFCHQLTHGEKPKIHVDGTLNLIYIADLTREISAVIAAGVQQPAQHTRVVRIPHTATLLVSELLDKLEMYKTEYLEKGIIPDLNTPFDRNLFNTFLCYIDHTSFFPFSLKKHSDERGSFVETVKLNSGGQVSFSTTVPGVTRGNHFHTRKAERFAVIKGKAKIELRRIGTNEKLVFELDGREPAFVDMPVWHTHNITNIGEETLYTIFWISEFFDPEDADTFFEKV